MISTELDLTQLLKGCEGEELYCPSYGKCVLNAIYKDNNNGSQPLINVTLEDGTNRNFSANGKICWAVNKFAPISLFPYALYEKYPLDAKKAWDEWASERKPKRWRAGKYQGYYYIDFRGGRLVTLYDTDEREEPDNNKYDSYNYFRTKEEAKQAAEGVREYLQKFHEKNSEK